MPSGSKKRKAAKKKKEAHTNKNNNGNSNAPRGNDDARSQDERDSDGGEVGSPVSQDHQPPSSEENDETKRRDSSTAPSFLSDNKPQETENEEGSKGVAVEDNVVVKTERDFTEEDAESKVHIEHVESAKEATDGDSSSSTSSSSSGSSDDESHSYHKKWNEEAGSTELKTSLSSSEEKAAAAYSDDATPSYEKEKPLAEPNGNTIVEATPPVDTSAPVVPLGEVVERVMESSKVQSTEVLEVVELGVQLNDGKFFPRSDEVAAVSTDAVVPEKSDDKVSPTLEDKDVQSLKAETSPVINGSESKTLTSADLAAESSIKTDIVNDSRNSNDLQSGNKDEELPTSNVQISQSSDVTAKAKDSESREFTTEDQPLVAPAPRVEQRTSWMSCCGILDVFIGSGR